MILDLERFIATERPHWESLEQGLRVLESGGRLDLGAARRFMVDYERAAADLIKLATFTAEPATRLHLEALVARAYAELHEERDPRGRASAWRRAWHGLVLIFPRTFRRHLAAFRVSLASTLVGVIFGVLSLVFDPGSRSVTMAFGHDQLSPSERVAQEESQGGLRAGASGSSFAAFLMQNNIKVSILALALGMTLGVGTLIVLFHNGVILGAVAADYVMDGEGRFLAGWILPHGSIELPAILIAGQAGLMLGHVLLGRGAKEALAERLRALTPDLVTLIAGVAVMLVWAGMVEGTFSQWHEPALPYAVKIAFGLAQLAGLTAFLGLSGRTSSLGRLESGPESGSSAPTRTR